MSPFHSRAEEDRFLHEQIFNRIDLSIDPAPVFLEAGAMDGVRYSNTKFFEDECGWTGILVEPHPLQYEALVRNRPGCHNANCLLGEGTDPQEYVYFENENLAAVSGIKETLARNVRDRFYESDEPWLVKARERHLKSAWLTPRPLAAVIEESGFDHLTLLSLDVEGHELSVLRSMDWSIPVDVLLVETIDEGSEDRLAPYLRSVGFRPVCTVAHNTLFASHSFVERHPLPLFDR